MAERYGLGYYRPEEQRRLQILTRAPDMLDAWRPVVPDDPSGGHRPILLGGATGDHERPNAGIGVACLDCPWMLWSIVSHDWEPAARAHRALHLDPPVESLCECHYMPEWYYCPAEVWRDRLACWAGEDWPPPAVTTFYHAPEAYEGDHWVVCAECETGLLANGLPYRPPGTRRRYWPEPSTFRA